MEMTSVIVGAILSLIGAMGLRHPDSWGRRYQSLMNKMPKFYRDANVWEGTDRELSMRLSGCWIAVGAIFIAWPAVAYLW